VRERFYVELAPGYVRLRHQLGLRTKFGRRGLTPLEARLVRCMEAAEDAGQPVDFGEPDPDDLERLLGWERQNQKAADEALAAMDPWELEEHRAVDVQWFAVSFISHEGMFSPRSWDRVDS
jgi:hypothetical protein